MCLAYETFASDHIIAIPIQYCSSLDTSRRVASLLRRIKVRLLVHVYMRNLRSWVVHQKQHREEIKTFIATFINVSSFSFFRSFIYLVSRRERVYLNLHWPNYVKSLLRAFSSFVNVNGHITGNAINNVINLDAIIAILSSISISISNKELVNLRSSGCAGESSAMFPRRITTPLSCVHCWIVSADFALFIVQLHDIYMLHRIIYICDYSKAAVVGGQPWLRSTLRFI